MSKRMLPWHMKGYGKYVLSMVTASNLDLQKPPNVIDILQQNSSRSIVLRHGRTMTDVSILGGLWRN